MSAASNTRLPRLPMPESIDYADRSLYTADQMRDYALAALATPQSADQPVAFGRILGFEFKDSGGTRHITKTDKLPSYAQSEIVARVEYSKAPAPSPSATVTEAMVYAAVRSVGVTANPREWNRLMAKTLTAALRAGDER